MRRHVDGIVIVIAGGTRPSKRWLRITIKLGVLIDTLMAEETQVAEMEMRALLVAWGRVDARGALGMAEAHALEQQGGEQDQSEELTEHRTSMFGMSVVPDLANLLKNENWTVAH
jgi:hypothetical protein